MSRRPPAPRRPAGLATSSLALLTAAVGGLFAMGAVPAPSILLDREIGSVAAERVSPRGAAATLAPDPGDAVELGSLIEHEGPGSEALDPLGHRVLTIPAEEESLVYEGADGEHIDADRIRVWLEDRDSPMAPFAEELVAAGIEHEVDPRLVVGIAAIESSAGERLPPGSHNAWGWNGDGPHGLQAWPSWPVAIDSFTEGLARVYDTDNVDERMARKYVPPNWQKWLRTVRWVMDDI